MPSEDFATIPDALLAIVLAHCDDPLVCGSTCQRLRKLLWQDELWANACIARWGEYSNGAQTLGRFNYSHFNSFRIAYKSLANLSMYEGIYSAAEARPYGLSVRIELLNERCIRCDAIKDQDSSMVFQADILDTGRCRFHPGAVHGLSKGSNAIINTALFGPHSCSDHQPVVLRATRIPTYGETCYCGGPFGSPHDLNCGCDHSLDGMVRHLLATEMSSLATLSDMEVNEVPLLKFSPLFQSKDCSELSGPFSIIRGCGEERKFGHEIVSVRRMMSGSSLRDTFAGVEFWQGLGLENENDSCLTAYVETAFEKSMPSDDSCDRGRDGQGVIGKKATAKMAWLVGTKMCGDEDIPTGGILFIIALDQDFAPITTSRHSACIHLSRSEWDFGDIFLHPHKSTKGEGAWQVSPNRVDAGFMIKQLPIDLRHHCRGGSTTEPALPKKLSDGSEHPLRQPYSELFDV